MAIDQQATIKDYGATLAVFRIGFGLMMLLSVIRFWSNGWIEKLYLEPTYFFSYQYFEWVKPLGPFTYGIFFLAALGAIGIMLGWRYRLSATLFFLSFTYVELMDKTTYLNHYYFISLLALVMVCLPAADHFSLDARRRGPRPVRRWAVVALRIFVGIVYFYAGLAKLNSDWLLQAQPLAIWLPSRYDLPLLGDFLQRRWVHYAFAWAGALYDLTIPFLLLWRPTRWLAFVAVVVFHALTRILFPIGMFPFIMIVSALVFFEPALHEKIIAALRKVIGARPQVQGKWMKSRAKWPVGRYVVYLVMVLHLVLPWRHFLNEGELFWTEEGYRFGWRVMLMEKAGYLTYSLVDPTTGNRRTVDPGLQLTTFQTKQLATQPDFILEYAHHLAQQEFERSGTRPGVYADSYVALNGRGSQRYVRDDVDLTQIRQNTPRVEWMMPFRDTIYGF